MVPVGLAAFTRSSQLGNLSKSIRSPRLMPRCWRRSY